MTAVDDLPHVSIISDIFARHFTKTAVYNTGNITRFTGGLACVIAMTAVDNVPHATSAISDIFACLTANTAVEDIPGSTILSEIIACIVPNTTTIRD
jgi:hypothetical protein